jgi:hypothetical protein
MPFAHGRCRVRCIELKRALYPAMTCGGMRHVAVIAEPENKIPNMVPGYRLANRKDEDGHVCFCSSWPAPGARCDAVGRVPSRSALSRWQECAWHCSEATEVWPQMKLLNAQRPVWVQWGVCEALGPCAGCENDVLCRVSAHFWWPHAKRKWVGMPYRMRARAQKVPISQFQMCTNVSYTARAFLWESDVRGRRTKPACARPWAF